MFRRFLLLVIRWYQATLSLDHGPLRLLRPAGQCKFYPSCSQYSYQAIAERGVWRGIFLTLNRLRRCHPWSAGGVDELN